MAASSHSLASSFFSGSRKFSGSTLTPRFSLPKSLLCRIIPGFAVGIISAQLCYSNCDPSGDQSNSGKKLLETIFVACTFVALSSSLFLDDVDPASAFVVASLWKLQTDELAMVRLFQENTPSIFYITNLASRMDIILHHISEVTGRLARRKGAPALNEKTRLHRKRK